MTPIRFVAALGAALFLSACSMEKNAVQDITAPVSGGQVRFFNFGYGTPSVNFYANDVKITAISSATGVESTSGVAYGSVGNAGNYSVLAAGSYTFAGKSTVAADSGRLISSILGTVVNGKRYSVYQSGPYNTTAKTVDGFVVEDEIPATFDWSKAYIRFVHASNNSSAMTLNARDSVLKTLTPIATTTAYKSASTFIAITPGLYEMIGTCGATCNATGAGFNSTEVRRSGITLTAGRYYTVAIRGDITLNPTLATATNRTQFDVTANR